MTINEGFDETNVDKLFNQDTMELVYKAEWKAKEID
jgi:hypothetical protein